MSAPRHAMDPPEPLARGAAVVTATAVPHASGPAHVLYAQFIEPGDLVFDIGANVGLRTSVFLDLGARVVAVEPQAESAALIDRRATVLSGVGVGARAELAELMVCTEPACSTFSQAFIDDLNGSGLLEYEWRERRSVPLVTLDALTDLFGEPAFVKIDTEGFEDQVLWGLKHTTPAALSFEAHSAQPDKLAACLELLAEHGENVYEYAYSPGETFQLGTWGDAASIPGQVGEWGDVYARLRA